ncbi:MAG TPA: hypothetical protein VE631_00110 [Alphaproteobacteria bacterium]|nr:hypothetical protein [Alphaproteobacteria bacterium]
MRVLTRSAVLVLMLALAGCSNMTEKQERALSGGAIGTGAGLLVGALTGAPVFGAVVGAGAGAIIGANSKSKDLNLNPGSSKR